MPKAETAKCPGFLHTLRVLPKNAVISSITSADITPHSSLLRTHAPDQIPPSVSVFPCTLGLCRLSLIPAGRWPFPTLSPQSLYRCLDPYPATPLWCTCSFLPKGQRPHLQDHRFGTLDDRLNATSTTRPDFGAAVIPLCSGSHTR